MQTFGIEELIPQRSPFIMIDQLVDFSEGVFTATFQVRADNYFVEDGLFQAEGLIENMAQTASAGAGYGFKIANTAIKLGYIGALKNLHIYQLPKIGTQINTKINIVSKIWNVDIVAGQVYNSNNELIAECEMKIFIDNSEDNQAE